MRLAFLEPFRVVPVIVDGSESDQVRPDTVGPQLQSERLDEAIEPVLADHLDGRIELRSQRVDRPQCDDAAAPALHHAGSQGLCKIEARMEVDSEYLEPLVVAVLPE